MIPCHSFGILISIVFLKKSLRKSGTVCGFLLFWGYKTVYVPSTLEETRILLSRILNLRRASSCFFFSFSVSLDIQPGGDIWKKLFSKISGGGESEILDLKGMFAKNERGYRLTAIKKRF